MVRELPTNAGDSSDLAQFDYLIGNCVLSRRSCVDDLGVNYDCNLHFEKHIENIVSVAGAKVGLLFRGFKTRDVMILGALMLRTLGLLLSMHPMFGILMLKNLCTNSRVFNVTSLNVFHFLLTCCILRD